MIPVAHGKLPRGREFIDHGGDAAIAASVEDYRQGGCWDLLAGGAGAAFIRREDDQALLLVAVASHDAVGRFYPWTLSERWPWPQNGHHVLCLAYRLARLSSLMDATREAIDARALAQVLRQARVEDFQLEQDRAWHALRGVPVDDPAALWGCWNFLRTWPEQQGCSLHLGSVTEVLAAVASAWLHDHGAAHVAWTANDNTQTLALAKTIAGLPALIASPSPAPWCAEDLGSQGDLAQHLQRALVHRGAGPAWWQHTAVLPA